MKRRKNIRRIPSEILSKIDKIENDKIVVAAKRAYTIESIRNGHLKHLGIRIVPDGTVIGPSQYFPPAWLAAHQSTIASATP